MYMYLFDVISLKMLLTSRIAFLHVNIAQKTLQLLEKA